MERKAKFIINSVRVYEFWGYDWWLPLNDQEFIDYCLKLPKEYLAKKVLFKAAVDRMYKNSSSYAIPKGNKPKKAIIWILKHTKTEARARKIYYRWFKSAEAEYKKHPLLWYGLVEKADFKRLYYYSGNEIINTILVRKYLDELNSILG
jgi:hypothetical protein